MANIGKYIEEANNFFRQVASELGDSDDIDHATRVTMAFLHTLRDRISVEESMHLISQLPMLLKGLYVDGWKITKQRSNSKTADEFIEEMRTQYRNAGWDLGDDQQAADIIAAIISVMKNYVDEGELDHIRGQLPQSIAALVV